MKLYYTKQNKVTTHKTKQPIGDFDIRIINGGVYEHHSFSNAYVYTACSLNAYVTKKLGLYI